IRTEAESSEWEDPILFDRPEGLPSFPVEVLSPWVRDYVHHLAIEQQVPVDLPAMLVLPILSGAVAGKFQIEVRPGWIVVLSIYALVPLGIGERKTPTVNALIRPTQKYELLLADQMAPRIREALADREIAEADKRRALGAFAKAKPAD